jgi:uncharacterized protein YndB with AHSA1/START domain
MTFDPGPLADARVVPSGDQWTLIFLRELRHPPAAVWRALTDPAALDQWAPFRADRGLGAVGSATLTSVDGADEVPLAAEVRVAKEPELLEYVWGGDLLRWELEPSGSGTLLTLRHTLMTPDVEDKVAAGWHLCIAVLARLLDGDPVGVVRGQAALAYGWEDLRAAYAEKFRRA